MILFASFYAVSCGSSSPVIPPPPPPGNFSNASLNGHYAFSMHGLDLNGAYFSRVGSFFADGNGNITGALADLADHGLTPPYLTVSYSAGTYSILPSGQGTLSLTSNTGVLQLSIVLNSASQGFLVETDLLAASQGNFSLQSPAAFSQTAINGKYVFDVSGVSFSATNVAAISMMGEIQTDGNGMAASGVMDVNDGNAPGPSGAISIAPGGAYQLDPANGNGANFGRGTLSMNGRSFVFYIVDGSRMKWMEEDSSASTQGDALQQSSDIATQNSAFMGSFVYLINGSTSAGKFARAARFSADGNGNLGTIHLDDNNNGNAAAIQQGANLSKATYAIDPLNAGSGRGTFTFTDSRYGTFYYVFYQISPAQAVLQDVSKGTIGDGAMLAQAAGPFTNSAVAGHYAFAWDGMDLGSRNAIPFEKDFTGQYTLSSSNTSNVSGAADFVDLGLNGKNFHSLVPLTGNLQITGDGTSSNTCQFVLDTSPSATLNYKAYFVDSQTVLLLEVDSSSVLSGIASQQH
jgi:hypothetical protein